MLAVLRPRCRSGNPFPVVSYRSVFHADAGLCSLWATSFPRSPFPAEATNVRSEFIFTLPRFRCKSL